MSAFLVIQCKTATDSEQITGKEDNSAKQENFEDEFSNEEKKPAEFVQNGSLRHPEEITEDATTLLLLTEDQPSDPELQKCESMLKSIAEKIFSYKGLDKAEQDLSELVGENPPLYHWCFYQLMSQLDIKLKSPVVDIQEKSKTFASSMKELWILAKTMGEESESNIYCIYLRNRYLQINLDYFGRRLEIVKDESCNLDF
ncbi:MAG: hypothetical protein KBD78_13875 [Oligoflexales bacterium]|nr:hypothetical protein [Oligoflexales bacterium]